MSELQISMIAIGVGLVGAVWGYNWWQERTFRRRAEQAFEKSGTDVLLEKQSKPIGRTAPYIERLEPSLADFGQPEPDEDIADYPDQEIVTASTEVDAVLDRQIDFIAEFLPGEPFSARKLLVAVEDSGNLGKPVRWMGLSGAEGWQQVVPNAGQTFTQLRAGLQLADRKGPVSESQLLEFVRIVRTLGEELGAVVDLPQRQPALTTAGELDAFCAEVDVLIGLNIVSQDGIAFPATKIRSLCEAAGMHLAEDGMFQFQNEHGQTLFSLCNLGQESFSSATIRQMKVNAVTILFDVPRVVGGIQVFDRVVALAQHIAASLEGVLVDDNRRPLNEAGLGAIRRQLSDIYRRMEMRGISVGSTTALRLFA